MRARAGFWLSVFCPVVSRPCLKSVHVSLQSVCAELLPVDLAYSNAFRLQDTFIVFPAKILGYTGRSLLALVNAEQISACRHILLAWERAQAAEGRGWDHYVLKMLQDSFKEGGQTVLCH